MEQPTQQTQTKVKRQYKKKVKSEPVTVEVNIVKNNPVTPNSSKNETTKKAPSKFSLFVKNNCDKVRNIPNQDRMKKLAEMYQCIRQKNPNNKFNIFFIYFIINKNNYKIKNGWIW